MLSILPFLMIRIFWEVINTPITHQPLHDEHPVKITSVVLGTFFLRSISRRHSHCSITESKYTRISCARTELLDNNRPGIEVLFRGRTEVLLLKFNKSIRLMKKLLVLNIFLRLINIQKWIIDFPHKYHNTIQEYFYHKWHTTIPAIEQTWRLKIKFLIILSEHLHSQILATNFKISLRILLTFP